jgi:hypothetical protein
MGQKQVDQSFAKYVKQESDRLERLVQTASRLNAILPLKTKPVHLNPDGTVKRSDGKRKKK